MKYIVSNTNPLMYKTTYYIDKNYIVGREVKRNGIKIIKRKKDPSPYFFTIPVIIFVVSSLVFP